MANFLFDLDGTLTDPAQGITNSIRYALRRYGIEETDYKKLCLCIGPPLLEAFPKYWGMTAGQAREALDEYRVYFSDRGIYENKVYAGIPELLKALCGAGHRCFLATSKPEVYAVRILAHFGLDRYFTAVCGNTMAEDRSGKQDVIACLLADFPDMTAENTYMVGDRCYDMEGACATGLRGIGVCYGYGSAEELREAGAWKICDTVKELEKVLLSLSQSKKPKLF